MSLHGGRAARDQAEAASMALELGRILFWRAMRMTGGDWDEAEDLVQEALTAALAAWNRIGGRPRDGQLAWLTSVMTNKKVDAWRSERKGSYPVAEVPDIRAAASPESVVLSQQALARCDAVISSMPAERRKVAFLRWYCGWTTREIAEWNGIKESTVRGHVMKALRQLNAEVRPELPFIDDIPDDDEEIPGEREEA